MNKTTNFFATFTLSILVIEFGISQSKLAAKTYNNFAPAEEFYRGKSANYLADNSRANCDVTVEDELQAEAPYNESAANQEFYEHGASAYNENDNSQANCDRSENNELETEAGSNEGLNSEDIKVDDELETEAESFQ